MWMLIDLSYLAHRARHSLKDLASEEMPTGVLYGFFEQLYHVCALPRFASNKVVIFADSKQSWRTRAFPDYKKKRAENRTEEEWEQIHVMHAQLKILREDVLPAVGFPLFAQKGLESDDLLAWAAADLTRREEAGVMITGDGDLYQSITSTVLWYDTQRNLLHDPQSFQRKKGVRPDQWGMVKAIGGCSTDGVPGIRGVSEQGAIDFLHDKIPHHHKKYQAIQNAISQGELERWKELVVLPHARTKAMLLRPPVYNPEAFFAFCEKYEIDSYLEGPGRARWEAFFTGRFPGAPRRRGKLI